MDNENPQDELEQNFQEHLEKDPNQLIEDSGMNNSVEEEGIDPNGKLSRLWEQLKKFLHSSALQGAIIGAFIVGFCTFFSSDLAAAIFTEFAARSNLPATVEAARTYTAEEIQKEYESIIIPGTIAAGGTQTAGQLVATVEQIHENYERDVIPAAVSAASTQIAKEIMGSRDKITPVSLLSVSYRYGGWNPKIIDMRSAADSGIPAWTYLSFQFFDLWLSVPTEVPEGYEVQARIYREPDLRGEVLGQSDIVRLKEGIFKIATINIEPDDETIDETDNENVLNFDDGYFEEDDSLYIALVVTDQNNQEVATTVNRIRFDRDGTALLADMPIGNIISILYSVNDGPQLYMDLPAAQEMGVNAGEGDTITLHRVWYHVPNIASFSKETEAHLSAYIAEDIPDDQPTAILCKSSFEELEKGIHEIEQTSVVCESGETQFRYEIPNDNQHLVLNLSRQDGTLLHQLNFDLTGSDGASGLTKTE